MYDSRDNGPTEAQAGAAAGQVVPVLSVRDEGADVAGGAYSARYRHDQRVGMCQTPVSVRCSDLRPEQLMPLTQLLDDGEGPMRVRLFSGPPSMKAVLLALKTCQQCGEAVESMYAYMCPWCDCAYSENDDELPLENRRGL